MEPTKRALRVEEELDDMYDRFHDMDRRYREKMDMSTRSSDG